MNRENFVVVVGPFPPPYHGQSKNTNLIAQALRGPCELVTANTSGGRAERNLIYHLTKFRRVINAILTLCRYRSKQSKCLYVSLDSGYGLLYNLATVSVARLLGYRIVCHHRSFSYIERHNPLMASVVKAAGVAATHVFLCESMAQRFMRQYACVRPHLVVSNAGHARPPETELRLPRKSPGRFAVGLLSNLCAEKGLYDFIDCVRRATQRGLNLEGILAGPLITLRDQAAVENAQRELAGRLSYVGPVYGDAKDEFFRSIDVFLFPTRYAVEAQPNVLFEALSYGVPVISNGRGCVASDIQRPSGYVVDQESDFASEALAIIERWLSDPNEFDRARSHALTYMREMYEKGQRDLDMLITTIVCGSAVTNEPTNC